MNKNIFFNVPQSFFFQFGLGFIFHQFCDLCLTQKHLKAVNLRGPGYTQFVKHCRRVFPVTAQVRSFLMCLLSRPSPFQNNVLCHKTMGWKNPKSGATKALIWDYRNGCPKSKSCWNARTTGCLDNRAPRCFKLLREYSLFSRSERTRPSSNKPVYLHRLASSEDKLFKFRVHIHIY